MMCSVIDNPASCESHTVICLLHAKIMTAVEILHELCVVYGQNITREGTVGQLCRMFMMKSTVVGRF
jgi:hypothetical protein